MSLETPMKGGHLILPLQNGESRVNGVNSIGDGGVGKSPAKPGFFVSFLVDARGGKMRGKRHSGVDLIIPPSKVCMPTRITCKLIKRDKVSHPPILKEGEALASRIAEMGPVGEKFLGCVLIELPHFASRIDKERELIILRSETGTTWHEHHSQTPSDSLNKLISSENDVDEGTEKRVVRIFTADFPRYFVVMTRARQDSKIVGSSGGMVKSSISQAVMTFPENAISKDIKVGLQVVPVASETVIRLVGQPVPMSAVTTIEPRRRKFHGPVTLNIPVPKEMQESIQKQKKDENPAIHILYSITSGNSPSQWEDITGSAPLNLVQDAVSFSTIVSARYWLMDCRNVPNPIKAAGEVFQDAVKAPFLAKFYILAKRHSATEAQVRVLCMTDDDINMTLECQEHFEIIGECKDVEVFEGKPYYLDMAGNFAPVAASGRELFITFYSFRVNRLSFVTRLSDPSQSPSGQLFLNKESVVLTGKAVEAPLSILDVTLPNFDASLISPDRLPENWIDKLEAAKLSVAQERPPVGPALRLTDIAEALQGDWVPLAAQLGISQREVVKIQTEYGSAPEQAILMLHLWVEKLGRRATRSELEHGLKRIGREDVINHCIYYKRDEALSDDQDTLNPIDSSFRSLNHSLDFETIQSVSKTENQPFAEVDEGGVYQIEEVWDGNQWHKTRKAVTNSKDLVADNQLLHDCPADEKELPSATVKSEEDTSLTEEPESAAPTVSGISSEVESRVIVPQLNAHSETSFPAATQPQIQAMELQLEVDNQIADVSKAVDQADTPEAGQFQMLRQEEPMLHETEMLLKPEEQNLLRVDAEVHHDSFEPSEKVPHIVEVTTTAESEHPEVTSVKDIVATEHSGLDMSASELYDVHMVPLEDDNITAKELTGTSINLITDMTVGDPHTTTEVEEFEETLDDGSVVKRKVIKTKQEQMVTQSFLMEGVEDDFNSAFRKQMIGDEDTSGKDSLGPSTVVEETEEILEDGTVVKHKVIKTTQQHFESSNP